MTEQERMINEAMAVLDGWDMDPAEAHGFITRDLWCCNGGGELLMKGMHLPRYTTSHDAVQRVIDGLSDFDCSNVFNDLYQMHIHEPSITERSRLVLKATPLQKCEAILRAKGLWTEEMGVEDE